MVAQHFRWDFIGLSTDTKPTPETSEKVVDGSTFYCSDTSKLYVYCRDDWYEKEVSGGGTTYTAGDNITIEGNVISATDTTYNNFTGTDGETAGASGLVPAPATTDAGKFLKADGTWDTAGGSTVTVVQTTGNSETSVMSQKATTEMIYPSDVNNGEIKIGNATVFAKGLGNISLSGRVASGTYNSISIGGSALVRASNDGSIAIGNSSATPASVLGVIALGSASGSLITESGTLDISTTTASNGFRNSNYRLIKGVYDGIDPHDGATVAQGNTLATSAPTTSTVGVLGQLYTDTTNMHTYQCTAISGDTYTWTQRW